MKLLLTSGGVTNPSITAALVDLLGRPLAECTAVQIPTAVYGMEGGLGYSSEMFRYWDALGWKELKTLELTALPSLTEDLWRPELEAADAILVGGGNTAYLAYWFHRSGFAEMLPALLERGRVSVGKGGDGAGLADHASTTPTPTSHTFARSGRTSTGGATGSVEPTGHEPAGIVYVGVSAGSYVLTPAINYDRERFARDGVYYDDEYDEVAPPDAGGVRGVGLVDFAVRPHLHSEDFPDLSTAAMERAAAKVDVDLYAIDDQSAIKVVDGQIEVVSEGEWEFYEADRRRAGRATGPVWPTQQARPSSAVGWGV